MNREEYTQILKMAIKNEVEAHDFYNGISSKVKDGSLKSIFSELAQEEKKHRQILEGYFNNPSKPLVFKETSDFKVSESVELPELSLEMQPSSAIALAMKKEEEAKKLYERFTEASEDEEQTAIFKELAKMESEHKSKLEDVYTTMAFPEVW